MHCPLCNHTQTHCLYQHHNMAYSTHLMQEHINLSVAMCPECNFVFQESAYTKAYDIMSEKLYANYDIYNVYGFPNRNIHHDKALLFVSDVVKDSIDYKVLEIGSNRGDFSYLLKEKFPKINIIGCEPSAFDEMPITTLNSFYHPKLFNTKFDLIILRHTLEHIKNPKEFVLGLQEALAPSGHIFIEVPHLTNSLKNGIEDFTPDHVNFFTPQTLSQTFSNFGITKIDEEGYLYMLFSPLKAHLLLQEEANITTLFEQFQSNITAYENALQNYKRIVFYGVGNFYMWTYQRLQEKLHNKALFYKDDNVKHDTLFNLDKLTDFEQGDLVILCSSNLTTQEKMKQTLPPFVDVLHPWKKITKGTPCV